MSKVFVIGDGAWGTALSMILSRNSHAVTLWSAFPDYAAVLAESRENTKFLPGVVISKEIAVTSDTCEAGETEAVVVAVPTKYLRSVLEDFRGVSLTGSDIISVAKGVENDSLKRPTEIIKELLESRSVCALSGPSHAEEVARFLPTAVVAASEDEDAAARFQTLFSNDRFRVYTSTDLIGVELAGALKNVIAIAAGICDGLGLGDNTKSALMTRGLEEIRRLGGAMGADRATFFGLSGVGDLITTCVSPHGRNRYVGERLGKGDKLGDIVASTETVAEGILTTRSVCGLADKYGVEVPISREVYAVAYDGKDPTKAVQDLMNRDLKLEF